MATYSRPMLVLMERLFILAKYPNSASRLQVKISFLPDTFATAVFSFTVTCVCELLQARASGKKVKETKAEQDGSLFYKSYRRKLNKYQENSMPHSGWRSFTRPYHILATTTPTVTDRDICLLKRFTGFAI